eukprot:1156931-Pleurochrysis_carterae.AAC.1
MRVKGPLGGGAAWREKRRVGGVVGEAEHGTHVGLREVSTQNQDCQPQNRRSPRLYGCIVRAAAHACEWPTACGAICAHARNHARSATRWQESMRVREAGLANQQT